MTGGAQDSGVERTPAQFFFECGYGAAYADAFMENGQKPAFTMSDAAIERAWAIAPECYPDPDEWDRYVARATPAPAGWQPINQFDKPDGTNVLGIWVWTDDQGELCGVLTHDVVCRHGEGWFDQSGHGTTTPSHFHDLPTAPAEGGV